MQREIRRREIPEVSIPWPAHVHPVLQRVYVARGVIDPTAMEHRLGSILLPSQMGGMAKAVAVLSDAIVQGKSITVAGDYDCDGATGTAVAVRGLRMLGAKSVNFKVPNRFKHGYGLTPALIDTMDPQPDLIVTVDSGVASIEGVAYAKEKGIQVVVTDHHLPGEVLPNADAIINPNLVGDDFPSKSLAGVGVMFYLLLALRQSLRVGGMWPDGAEPDIASLLDLVALGTVADLVVLDQNNRILVEAGLKRIRAGKACEGIKALLTVAERNPKTLIASDIAFAVAPRLNAAGRLENMSLGVLALITDNPMDAEGFVGQLDAINKERKELQAEMVASAEALVAQMPAEADTLSVTVYGPSWHAGVVGLVASRLKESLHRPVFAFAPGEAGSGMVHGSGRSIAGFHLRDALALVDTRNPGLLVKFGGHAMAAGLTIRTADVDRFREAFNQVATSVLTAEDLQAVIYTDGELPKGDITMEMAETIRRGGPWGQGFPEPTFENTLEVTAYRVLGDSHLKLEFRDPRDGTLVDGIWFNAYEGMPPPTMGRVAYTLGINEWLGRESLQLMVLEIEGL